MHQHGAMKGFFPFNSSFGTSCAQYFSASQRVVYNHLLLIFLWLQHCSDLILGKSLNADDIVVLSTKHANNNANSMETRRPSEALIFHPSLQHKSAHSQVGITGHAGLLDVHNKCVAWQLQLVHCEGCLCKNPLWLLIDLQLAF